MYFVLKHNAIHECLFFCFVPVKYRSLFYALHIPLVWSPKENVQIHVKHYYMDQNYIIGILSQQIMSNNVETQHIQLNS